MAGETLTEDEIEMNTPTFQNAVPLPTELYTNGNYNYLRRGKISMFTSDLEHYDITDEEKLNISIKLEKGCYNNAITESRKCEIRPSWNCSMFISIYHDRCFEVSCNINPSDELFVKSTYLIESILEKKINPIKVAQMPAQDLCPHKYEDAAKKMQQRILMEQNINTNKMVKCPKCHHSECILMPRPNRSADEGVNLTAICQFCMHSYNC